jgi:hypothetical protein
MRFTNPALPGRAVRLAYCLNLHPADTLEGLLEGLRTITLPLKERLAPDKEFGVGMYLPASLASRLAHAGGELEFARLESFLKGHALDPFTWNAFPYGGFGAEGLKARVFEPSWIGTDSGRNTFTWTVGMLALKLTQRGRLGQHASISTHTGWHSSLAVDEVQRHQGMVSLKYTAGVLSRVFEGFQSRAVLSLEAEPRANCNDTAQLASWRREILAFSESRPLGTCLDACHAAVEFEEPSSSLINSTEDGAPLGKIQFTSALSLRASMRSDIDPLLALDEPRYLHQVTARTSDGELLRVGDLPELRAALDQKGGEAWWRDSELRCHFHVPVDLGAVGGLGTTRDHADATLAAALAHPERWGTQELHVEIETYTWDVLPREARGPGELVDGLEREYRHVIERLEAAGWRQD